MVSVEGTPARVCIWKPKDNFVDWFSPCTFTQVPGMELFATRLAQQSPLPPKLALVFFHIQTRSTRVRKGEQCWLEISD